MDFGALPPEINSGRMYSGPGSAPLRTASAAWNLLAAELESAANQYQSTINVLADDEWRGPTSATMAAAVDPYITWMSTTGAQAEQTASQASAAATAYEAAFAMTVPPLEIAANRAQLAMLVATNVIGQNTPAIAANEAQYGEMWAQDAAAMYGYAGSSAAASTVKPFSQPPETSNPARSGDAGFRGHAGKRRQHRDRCAVATAATDHHRPVVVEATHLPDIRGGEPTGLSSAEFLDFLDGADGNSIGTFLNSSLVNGVVSGSYVSPAIITPGRHQRFGRHQLVGSQRPSRRPGGAGVTGMLTPLTPAPAPVSVPNVGVSVNTVRQHTGRQVVRPADVDGGSAGGQPQRCHVCRWRLDQRGGPDRRRHRSRPGRHARYAGRGRRQVRRIRSRSALRKSPDRHGAPAVRWLSVSAVPAAAAGRPRSRISTGIRRARPAARRR